MTEYLTDWQIGDAEQIAEAIDGIMAVFIGGPFDGCAQVLPKGTVTWILPYRIGDWSYKEALKKTNLHNILEDKPKTSFPYRYRRAIYQLQLMSGMETKLSFFIYQPE